jgi:hypothetical protein
VLRITTQEGPAATNLTLEGKLAGPWVAELEHAWQALRGPAGGDSDSGTNGKPAQRRMRVNMSAVTFVDRNGKQLLVSMYRQGVELHGCGCMTRGIIEEIKRASQVSE